MRQRGIHSGSSLQTSKLVKSQGPKGDENGRPRTVQLTLIGQEAAMLHTNTHPATTGFRRHILDQILLL